MRGTAESVLLMQLLTPAFFSIFFVQLFLKQGTNFGIHNHSAPIQPTITLDMLVQTHNSQSSIKAADLDSLLLLEFTHPRDKNGLINQYTHTQHHLQKVC
jgi:hypothetical protein